MKKILLCMGLLLGGMVTIAQNDSIPSSSNIIRENPEVWKQQLPCHEFAFSWGDAYWPLIISGQYSIWVDVDFRYDFWNNSEPSRWFNEEAYDGKTWTLGAFSLSYMYRPLKWFWVGVAVNYSGCYTNVFSSLTHELLRKDMVHIVTVMPQVRFSYLNRPHVTLYSGFSVGFGVETESYSTEKGVYGHCAGQLTAFGVKAGSKWFGLAEIGYGYKGFGLVGFGYNF